LLAGGRATWFLANASPRAAYKSWIAGSLAPQGALVVDAGAANALRTGKSLLAAGVRDVQGAFEKGEAVRIVDEAGVEVARGLSRYDAEDARRIMGRKSAEVAAILGYDAGAALVHADDMALRS